MSPEKKLHITRWVFGIAGAFIITSLALGYYVAPYFYLFTLFVGVNMFQFSFTTFCPLALILDKIGVGAGK